MSYKVDISHRPKWWIKVVQDYEDNVLGQRFGNYPNSETEIAQKKQRYGFTQEPSGAMKWIEFESEQDYAWFMLRWT